MFPAFPIGRIFGVKIRLHLLFIILIAFLVLSDWPGPGISVQERLTLIGILWTSVLFHELGHSLVAKRFNVQVLDITFWPLGGMARFANFPSNPRIELPISLAGPLVNFVIALFLLPFLRPEHPWFHWIQTSFWINLALGAFNLVPAFPMDGGRVLRAALGFKMDYLHSTEIAVRIGKWLALGMFIAAFIYPHSLMLIVVAVFIWFSATQELWSVRLRHATRGGNPFVFWKSFQFGGGGNPAPQEAQQRDTKDTQKELENFKGSLSEFFEKKKDPDGP